MRKTHFISLPGQVPLFSLLLLIVSQKPVAAAIRYVNRQAAGTNSGESWTNAFTEVRSALLASSDRDEIWIASGTYYPDYNTFTKQHTGDRGMRFRLNPGVAMYGGFAGGETSRGHRDWIANPVIFSGDIGQRNVFTDNTQTILEIPTGNARSIIEGIVFMLGNANIGTELGNGDVAGSGGAIWAAGDARIRFCSFVGNYAVYGGAIYARASVVKLTNCIFHDNRAQYVGGAFQVGLSGDVAAGSEVINCSVTGCTGSRGGAFTSGARSVVKNNVVWGNTGSSGWELVEIWTDASVSNNLVQEPLERYPGGGVVANSLIISTPSAGPDGRWGTADDDYYGGGLASNSPARDILTPANLPLDVTDLDGDGSTTEPIPYDSLRRNRVLGSLGDAGALELLNLPPTALQLQPSSVEENKLLGTTVGSLSSVDANAGPFIYSLVVGEGAEDNEVFRVQGALLQTARELDFESKPIYFVRVRTTDSLGEFFEQALRITVIDVIDQRVAVQAVTPNAYFPIGGIPLVGTGQWPAHCGAITVTRSGEVNKELTMFLELSGSAAYRNHYLIRDAEAPTAAVVDGRLYMTFAPSRTSLTFGVCPLFPGKDDYTSRRISFSVGDGGTAYDIAEGGAFAAITIHPSPRSAWSAAHPGAPTDEAGYIAQLFPAEFLPGTGFQPYSEYRSMPVPGWQLALLARPSLTARDLQPAFEISQDLIAWRRVNPETYSRDGGWMEYRFSSSVASTAFIRTSAEVWTRPLDRVTGGGVPLRMAGIPAGRIILGSQTAPAFNASNAQITQSFWLSTTEVTRAQYASTMNLTAPLPGEVDFPVTVVSWEEAKLFADRLTSIESGRLPAGYGYRLPTEAEWEYASAGGTELETWLPIFTALHDCAWFAENSFAVSHRVGLKQPNAWGLYDMYGNAAEWVSDWSGSLRAGVQIDPSGPVSGTFRAVRGGHFNLGASAQSSWWRSSTEPGTLSPNLGFRIALAPPLGSGGPL